MAVTAELRDRQRDGALLGGPLPVLQPVGVNRPRERWSAELRMEHVKGVNCKTQKSWSIFSD